MSKFDWLIVVKGRLMLPIVAKNNATEVRNFVLIYRELLQRRSRFTERKTEMDEILREPVELTESELDEIAGGGNQCGGGCGGGLNVDIDIDVSVGLCL